MAYNYQNFATLGVNLNRQAYGALDISQVFNSQADLNYYISSGTGSKTGVSEYWTNTVPYPYAGQFLALAVDGTVTAYILIEDKVVSDKMTYKLQEVGKKREADGKTIDIAADGTVKVHGLEAATNLQIPQLKNGEIVWVNIPDVVPADTNTVTEVKVADGSILSVEKAYNSDSDEYTYTLDITMPVYAVRKEALTAENAVKYVLTKDGVDIAEPIIVPNAFDDSDIQDALEDLRDADAELAGDITALEEYVEGISTIIYKAENGKTYLGLRDEDGLVIGEDIDAAAFVKDGMLSAASFDTATKELVLTWNTDAEKEVVRVPVGTLVDVYTAAADSGIVLNDHEFSIDYKKVASKQSVDDLSQKIANDIAATISDMQAAIAENARLDAANKTELQGAIDTVDDKVDAHLAAYEAFKIANTAAIATAKDEAREAAKAFATEEDGKLEAAIDVKLEQKIDTVTVAHGKTEGAVRTNNTLAITVDTYTSSEIDSKISTAVSDAKTELNGVIDAAEEALNKSIGELSATHAADKVELQAGINANAKSIEDLEADVERIDGVLTTHADEYNALEGRVDVLEGKVAVNETDIAGLKAADTEIRGLIAGNTAAISELAGDVAEADAALDAAIKANTKKFDNYSTTAQVDTKIATAITDSEKTTNAAIKKVADDLTDEINRSTQADAAHAASIQEHKERLDGIDNTLKLVLDNTADEAINSLKEMATWVAEHEDDVVDMLKDISDDKKALADHKAAYDAAIAAINENIGDNAAAIAALDRIATDDVEGFVKTSDEVGVVASGEKKGQMYIKKVSTDLLVQGDLEFVIFGGNA